MCYHISAKANKSVLEKRFSAKHSGKPIKEYYHVSGFEHPELPIIRAENPAQIETYTWGLIPFWVNGGQQAAELMNVTLNAKSETIFEKPSFKYSIQKNRCIVLVDSFFEWRHMNKKTYPYLIKLKYDEPFALGGIYNDWVNKNTGEITHTFSIITTEANPLMAKIHNTKLRMPFILDKQTEKSWLNPDLKEAEIKNLMKPFDENEMQAYTISKLISRKDIDTNVPEVIEPLSYTELESNTLF